MGALAGGMTKQDYLDYEVRSSLVEGSRFDLVAMGRPEGSGCYCAVNHSLRRVIDDISRNYAFVVIDNEAGMEHLSRRTTRDVNFLLVVTDPTLRGLAAARRIAGFRHELDIHIDNAYLIVNKQNGPLATPLQAEIEAFDLPLLGVLPRDEGVAAWEMTGGSLLDNGAEGPLSRAADNMLQSLPLIPAV